VTIIDRVSTTSAGSVGTGVYNSTQCPQSLQLDVLPIWFKSVLFWRTVAHYQGSSLPLVKKMLVPWVEKVALE